MSVIGKNRERVKKIICAGLAAGLSVVLLSGCGRNDDVIQPLPIVEPIDTSIIEPSPEPTPEPEPVFSPENLLNGVPIVGVREVVNGMYQSYLTGAWKDVNVSMRRPIAFIMPNNREALPHYAITRADVVFEAAVEGRTSRLIAYFEDYDDLEFLGPARSARDYFIYDSMGREGIFTHWGLAVPFCADLINGPLVDNVSVTLQGISRGADEAFFRRNRGSSYAREFTGYLSIEGYNKAVSRLDYNMTYSSNFIPQFTFAAENTFVEYEDYPDATIIRPGGTTRNNGGFGQANSYFEYNEDDRLYYRYQFGSAHRDEMDDSQLTYTNVIFQYADGEVRVNTADYLIFGVHGENKAKVFTNGKVIEGTWRRFGGDLTPAKFYDENDNEIIFNQGKTWICLIWNTYEEFAVYE